MLRTHNHIGVVYDELGTWLGIVTMEDVLETILGQEILDETDKVIDMLTYAKLIWSNKKAGKNSYIINQIAPQQPTDSWSDNIVYFRLIERRYDGYLRVFLWYTGEYIFLFPAELPVFQPF